MYKKYHQGDLSEISFLITGGAGFIGSNIVEYLVQYEAKDIVILDNLSTGFRSNLNTYLNHPNVRFVEGDIRDFQICEKSTKGIDFVMHHAALGSVPRSINDPINTNQVNCDGFLNILESAKKNKVKRVIYASSSSVYGDDALLPKVESRVGNPLSPYAVSKKTNELYADVFYRNYGLECIGLRYFNIFGQNQSPYGEYAALIPKFINAILQNEAPVIYGDGKQARDFTHVRNAVKANILAIFANKPAIGNVFNIAVGEKTTINDLFNLLLEMSGSLIKPNFGPLRPGEIRDSLADISKAKNLLGYTPETFFRQGLEETFNWYVNKMKT